MEKVMNSLKVLLTFVFGYVLFSLIVSLVEIIFFAILSNSAPEVWKIIAKGFGQNIAVYTIIYLSIFVINIILNYISIKKLNRKLNEIKRKGENYEK